jgi:cytochrome c5
MATEQTTPSSRRTVRFGLPLALFLFAAAGVVSYVGVASRVHERPEVANPPVADAPGSLVVSITLPYEDLELPPGPHLHEFQVACTTCHSTRLAMTQPPFPKAKWEATVKKMVDAYGAPLSPAEQARAVDYLVAVRGK